MDKHVLYGAEISYFSGKARAYLRGRNLDFGERRAGAFLIACHGELFRETAIDAALVYRDCKLHWQ